MTPNLLPLLHSAAQDERLWSEVKRFVFETELKKMGEKQEQSRQDEVLAPKAADSAPVNFNRLEPWPEKLMERRGGYTIHYRDEEHRRKILEIEAKRGQMIADKARAEIEAPRVKKGKKQ